MRIYDPPRCNQLLIAETIRTNARIDGRKRGDSRQCTFTFGRDYGTVIVALGGTRILAKATCEIVEPKEARPSEGLMKVSVDLSPMAAPSLADARSATDENVEIVRMLERAIRETKCVDMEGLCIESGSKCWQVRIDLIALNSEGNLVEACSMALIAALAHFRRPDVTVVEDGVVIHSFDEKHPIPLTILHYPFCIKLCFFNESANFILDPLEAEEVAAEGYMIVAGNAHREVTALHVTGQATLTQEVIMKCSSTAIDKIKLLTAQLKEALSADKARREKGEILSFADQIMQSGFILTERYLPAKIEVDENDEVIPEKHVFEFAEGTRTRAYRFDTDAVGVGEGGPSKWQFMELEQDMDAVEEGESDDDKSDNDQIMETALAKGEQPVVDVASDEEEVQEVVLV